MYYTTINLTLLTQVLAYAPEELREEIRASIQIVIPAFCFTQRDILRKFCAEEAWDHLTDEEQQAALRHLLHAYEYDPVAALAEKSIEEAVVRYLHDDIVAKAQALADEE